MRCLILVLCVSVASAAQLSLARATEHLDDALATKDHAAASGMLARIGALYGSASEAEQKQAVKIVGKAARSKDLRTRHGAFAALGEMRVKGTSKYLRRWLSPPKKAKPSHIEAIRAAGRIADNSTLAALQKQTKHRDIVVAVTATEALGGFAGLKPGRKKTLAFDLVKRLEMLTNMNGGGRGRRTSEAQARANPVIAAQIKRREKLGVATVISLQQITGQSYRTLPGWTRWRERWKHKNPWK